MNKTRLEEIKSRFEDTTYGDWAVYDTPEGTHIGTLDDHPQLKSPAPVVSMSVWVEEPRHRVYIRKENAEFIAHSKQDMRWLIQQAEKLAALEEQLKNTKTKED